MVQDYGEDEENGEQWRCRVDHGGMREGSAEGQGVEAKSCDDQIAKSIRCCPLCVDKLEQRLLVISVSYIQSARRQLKVKCLSASVPASASSTHPSSYPQLTHRGSGDSPVVRTPDVIERLRVRVSAGATGEFLLRGQLSVLTLNFVSVLPPCYRSST